VRKSPEHKTLTPDDHSLSDSQVRAVQHAISTIYKRQVKIDEDSKVLWSSGFWMKDDHSTRFENGNDVRVQVDDWIWHGHIMSSFTIQVGHEVFLVHSLIIHSLRSFTHSIHSLHSFNHRLIVVLLHGGTLVRGDIQHSPIRNYDPQEVESRDEESGVDHS
jgi:hypothetical protein